MNMIDIEAEPVPGASVGVLQEFAACVTALFDSESPSEEGFFAELDAQFVPHDVSRLPEALRRISAMSRDRRTELLDGIGMTVGADADADEVGLLVGFADLVEAWLIEE